MVKLRYRNNINLTDIGEISVEELNSLKDSIQAILQLFQDSGHKCILGIDMLYVYQAGKTLPLDEVKELQDDAVITYYDILPLNNAAKYDRKNGILYFFHVSESEHINHPHIHAKYAENEISIYLRDFHVVGTLKNKSKQKEALSYVKDHLDDILLKWTFYSVRRC